MHAEILAIGDEITSGQTLDTNSQWLSRQLEELGVRVLYHTTVGDELEPCIGVFRKAIERADIVIATGGLGPTADDLTREALARAVGRELVLYPEALEHIRSLFASRKREMPKQNELQALFPSGSRMIVNRNGTAPGIDMEILRSSRNSCRFFALPGVPAEMRELWDDYLGEEIKNLAGNSKKIVRRKINCFGAGESQIESMLPDLIRRGRTPTVGITASNATISLRITAEAETEEECQCLIDPTVQIIRDCLGNLIFGESEESLEHVLVRLLAEKRQKLAIVEWGTGGLITHLLNEVPNSEQSFLGGIIAPSRELFMPFFSLEPDDLRKNSHRFEESLATFLPSLLNMMKADWLLLVGSFPEEHDIGTEPVLIAVGNAETVKSKAISLGVYSAMRKIYIAKQALNLARLTILGQHGS